MSDPSELDRIEDLPLEERAAAFAELHARLTAALDDPGADEPADDERAADEPDRG